jgi:hypothetical protein
MPNWCNNTITITGDYDTLVQLKPVLDKGEGLLDAIAPIGEWEYGNAVAAWGTKWDVSTEGLDFIDNGDGTATIAGWFESAWAPPVEAFQTLAEDWDSCVIALYYDEPGMCFVGYWDSEGADDHYEYDGATSDTVRNMIPEYLVDEFELEDRLSEMEAEEEEFEDV